jgi:hypothetical protein
MKIFDIFHKYGLDLDKNEELLYNESRNKRNNIIHGADTLEPTIDEYRLLSKIIDLVIKEELF